MRPASIATLLPLVLALLAPAASAQAAVADLVLRKIDFEEFETLEVGDIVSYSLNVTNMGPGRSGEVTLVDRFPEGLEFEGGPPGCALTAPGVVTCTHPDMGPGDLFGYLLSFRATRAGTFVDEAQVSAQSVDPNPTNNVDTESTTVASGAPTDLVCEALEGGIRLQWSGRVGAQYRIYRAQGNDTFVLAGTTNEETFFDGSVAPNATYRYRVTATFGGIESDPSEACEVTSIPFFPGWWTMPLAVALGVAGYALLRRRG